MTWEVELVAKRLQRVNMYPESDGHRSHYWVWSPMRRPAYWLDPRPGIRRRKSSCNCTNKSAGVGRMADAMSGRIASVAVPRGLFWGMAVPGSVRIGSMDMSWGGSGYESLCCTNRVPRPVSPLTTRHNVGRPSMPLEKNRPMILSLSLINRSRVDDRQWRVLGFGSTLLGGGEQKTPSHRYPWAWNPKHQDPKGRYWLFHARPF